VQTASDHVFLRLHTDEGIVGCGESAPLTVFTGETAASAREAIVRFLAPILLGSDPLDIEALVKKMDSLAGNPSAKAAVDLALHDIAGQVLGQPVYRLLGGPCRSQVELAGALGIGPPARMAEEARGLVNEGFRVLKMKIGIDPMQDVERVRAVREAVGNDVSIRVDANAAYDFKTALQVLTAIEKYRPEHVEQPVKPQCLQDMAALRRAVAIPIMADESVWSPEDAIRVIEAGAADVVGIKFSKCGGIRKALRIAAICEAAGIPCHLISAFETGIGVAANVHVALAHPQISRACELSLSSLQEDPYTTGFAVEGSVAGKPEGPGLGVRLKEGPCAKLSWEEIR